MSLSIRDRIDDIVALLQEARLNDSAWPAASALIDDTCGLLGNDLLLARFRPEGGIESHRVPHMPVGVGSENQLEHVHQAACGSNRSAGVIRLCFNKCG